MKELPSKILADLVDMSDVLAGEDFLLQLDHASECLVDQEELADLVLSVPHQVRPHIVSSESH